MLSKKQFNELKAEFTTQFLFPNNERLCFYDLLDKANRAKKRLVPYEKQELHDIYKDKKLSILPVIIKLLNGSNPPYPLDGTKKAIAQLAKLRPDVKGIDLKQICIAAMDAELNNPRRTQRAIESAVWTELEKITTVLPGGPKR